ncbi:MAG TPA: hypothetical protein VFG04_28475 [Planctomycetaceae bacterium]|jgi:hypothetical protein|nr:hypothetical protein [Planctomycetaceae bacterium]
MFFAKRARSLRTHSTNTLNQKKHSRRRNRPVTGLIPGPICCGPSVEELEGRQMLSASVIGTHSFLATPTYVIGSTIGPTLTPASQVNVPGYNPQQMQTAYGVNQIRFNGIVGNGAGQTIAIVDAFDDPNIIKDTATFNTQFGLQQFNVAGGPTFRVLNENGGTTPPSTKGQDWDVEESLDVQWAHSMAPQANIILFEADTNLNNDLFQAEITAADFPGVTVVSNSWGGDEGSGETGADGIFTTPAGHPGVTFLASTGDDGSPGGYPAYSPNVVAVGGTSLQLQQDGTWVSESVWGDGDGATGGGISQFEAQPSYQVNNVNNLSTTKRTIPDVAAEADPETGVLVYDTFSQPGYLEVGGTSLACPLWAGMVAVADQGRALAGLPSLDGPSQTLPTLYQLSSSDFHDITVGNNFTFSAMPGYDLVTGRGTPIANLLVPALAGYGTVAPIVNAPQGQVVAENSSLIFSAANNDGITTTDPFSAGSTDSLALSVSHGTLTLSSLTGLTLTGLNGSPSFTVSGTIVNLNAALNGLIYQPNSNYTGPDSLSVSLTDPGENLVGTATVPLSIVTSTGPKITAPTLASVSQNASLVFSLNTGNSITILDNDAGGNSDAATLSVSNGTLTLASITGLTFTSGTNGSATFTVTGTVDDLNTALNGLTYQPTAGYFGADLLAVTVVDPGDDTSSTVSVALTVNALAPAIGAPAAASVPVNQALVFSTANGNAVSVSDPNLGNDSLALSVGHGTLTLASLSGLTLTAGANGSGSLTATGSVSDLSAALNGLTYQPTSGYSGSDSLSVSITNLVDGKSTLMTIALTVEAVPTISSPLSASLPENSAFTFSSANGNQINVADFAAGSNPDTLTLSVTSGRLTLGSTTGLVFTDGSDGTASFTVRGTIGSLEAALNGLTYQPNFNFTGNDSIVLSLADSGDNLTGSSSVPILVNPIIPPVINSPGTASVNENGAVVFSATNNNAISIADNGIGNGADTASLFVSHGTLTLGNANGVLILAGANGSSSFTIKGTVTNLNAALNGLTYRPSNTYAGADSLSISVGDTVDSQSTSTSVTLNVIALPPAIQAPSTAFLSENSSLAFLPANANTISLTDANPSTDSLTLSVAHGTLTLASVSGLTFTAGANGTAAFTVTGNVNDMNIALNGLVYQPTAGYVGGDTLAISVLDQADNESASTHVTLSVSTPPSPAISAPTTASANENGSLVFTPGNTNAITITDAAAGANTDSLTLSVAHGTLTLATTSGLTFKTGTNGTASFTVTGSVANLNTALNGLLYRPASNYVGSDSLSIAVTDAGDNESGSAFVALSVTGSSAPSITAPPGAVVSQNGALAFSAATFNAIVVADSGPGSNSDSLSLTVSHGTVALGSTSGLTIAAGANGSSSITVLGSVANLDAALTGLIYEPTTGYTGSDALAISIQDAADSQSASANVSLSVKAGTAPSIRAPAVVSTKVNPVVFATGAINITDNSAGSSLQELSLKTNSGTLKLASTTGLTFISGANNTASMLIEGTLANLNAALSGLSLTLTSKSGIVVLAYVDLGNNLSGTAAINVAALGFTPVGPSSTPATGGGITNATASSMPPDAETQWKGLTAAVQLLVG